ncbi:aryl-alcohol oxidase-like protein [Lentinula edodes]|nr:aryl-alcohol oxidase-like protein [Lentinula edodes]
MCSCTYAALYTDPIKVQHKKYDFIVVGGELTQYHHTAGSVVAARLAEGRNMNILVIEAGISDERPDTAILDIPFFALGLTGGVSYDWNYTTTLQQGFNNRSVPYPRGFILGGSSSNNGLIYLRGPSQDWDRIANISGDRGWSWEGIQPYVFKSEKHVPSWSHRDDRGEYNPAVHGYGPLHTSLTANVSDLEYHVLKAANELGDEFSYNLDLNSGNGLGLGWFQNTVGNGTRISSSTAYLRPALSLYNNLDILIETRVVSLQPTPGDNRSLPDFRTVITSKTPNSPHILLTASKEVILCAGAIGTPQILMLSGIGPKEHLLENDIPVILESPAVGRNLQDQPVIGFQWSVPYNTLSAFTSNQSAVNTSLLQWQYDHTGILASSCAFNNVAFLRVPSKSVLFDHHRDPSAGSTSPHFQLVFYNGFLPNSGQGPPDKGNWISTGIVLQAPTSRGTVLLSSNSIFDAPIIDPAFLQTSWDIGVMVEGLKAMKRFFATSAWSELSTNPFHGLPDLNSDEAFENYTRSFAFPIKHPVGTARISKIDDKNGVVGPDLRLKHVQSLRIVDASVLPFAPGGYPQAQVYIMAERASDLIKEDHNLV